MRIVIVVAGIAGLTLALALRRVGLTCEIVEQTARLQPVGAGIQLAPNATRLLHRLGLEPHLVEVAIEPAAFEMRRWEDHRLIARTPLGQRCREAFGAPYHTVHRADLHRILMAMLPDGFVQLGKPCVRLLEQADGVRLEFADGSHTTVDVVVGADGIHSVVRAALIADTPRFSGQAIYRGLVPAQKVPFLCDNPAVTLWLGPGQHCVCYPVSSGQGFSMAASFPTDEEGVESWSAVGQVADVAAAYAGWCTEVQQLIGALDSVKRWVLYDRDPLVRWSTERITLVGDAAVLCPGREPGHRGRGGARGPAEPPRPGDGAAPVRGAAQAADRGGAPDFGGEQRGAALPGWGRAAAARCGDGSRGRTQAAGLAVRL
jgi:salicylate hydroxylase